MREIRFRAWDLQKKKMNSDVWVNQRSVCIDGTHFLSDEIMVPMQFTGLKDKNGRDMFEGDRVKRGELGVSVIGFEEGAFVLLEGENEPLSHYNHEEWEIIGNIYED